MKLGALLHLFTCSLKVSPCRNILHKNSRCVYTSSFTAGRPRIIKPPEDLQVVDGVIVTFDCFALAEPLHSLTWYFTSANGSNVTIASINGTEKMITHGGKYQITDNSTSPDEYGRLLVRDVQFEERGTYTCLAENRHGLDSASATLAVQGE